MKNALVTGSSSGIGRSITDLLLAEGWKVYGVSRSKQDTRTRFIPIQIDLKEITSIDEISEVIGENSIDLLVSNAGVAFEESASRVTLKSYQEVFEINVLAPMLIISKLISKINKATIISISSVSDRLVDKDYALYCSSKAANTRYFESLAQEMTDARVFTLLPDYVDTPMLRKLQQYSEFNWDEALLPNEIAQICLNLENGEIIVPTGSNIIIVNDALKDDLESIENLYGYNTSKKQLQKLN